MAAAAARLLLLPLLGCVRPGACTDPPDGGWLAGTVPEEPRCTVERADASLTYSLFLQRFAFSRPVILGGVTDNSVSAGRAQTVPGGTHLPVPRERRPHPAPRSPSRRRSEPSAPGRSCWRRSGPSRCGSARPTPTRTAKVSGGPRPAAGSRFPRSPLRSRSGCAVPGVRGAPAEAAGPGPAGQRWVALSPPRSPGPSPGSAPVSPPDTLYFFGDNNFTEWGPLFQHYVPPPFRIPGTSPAYSFGIAGGCGMGPGRDRAGTGGSPQHQPPLPPQAPAPAFPSIGTALVSPR
uniref:Uncharacterized protein n=1 Tax=Ficedula albicollis TaxID=59894 RepID=U3JPN5_FICAL